MRLLARQLLTGIYREIATDAVFESERAFDVAKGTLINGDGIGQPLISRALKDMPGMTEHNISDSLCRLKASGNYARTLLDITQQIEAEAETARLEAEARHFPPFPPVPMGGASAAKIVQGSYILAEKLYTERPKNLYKVAW